MFVNLFLRWVTSFNVLKKRKKWKKRVDRRLCVQIIPHICETVFNIVFCILCMATILIFMGFSVDIIYT